jgi:hypothetical protein
MSRVFYNYRFAGIVESLGKSANRTTNPILIEMQGTYVGEHHQ